jgi:hypothetical protein
MSTSPTQTATASFSNILADNKNMMSTIEDYRAQPITAKKRNLAFTGMCVGGSLLAILFASQIITGMFALILTGFTLTGGYFGWKTLKTLDPAIQEKLKNKKLELMIKEARVNAIYQLDRQVLSNTARLEKGQAARDKLGGTLRKMKGKLDPEKEGTPFYKKQVDLIHQVQDAYDKICQYLISAKKTNKQFEEKVYEYKQLDALSNMANEALSSFKGASGMNLKEMLSLESFEAIEDSFNTSLTALENRASDLALEG